VESKTALAFMMPNDFCSFKYIHRFLEILVPWCPYQLKTSDKWEQQCVHKILDQAAEVVHQLSGDQTHIRHGSNDLIMRNQGISLFMCACLLEIMSFDDGVMQNNQQERTFPWKVFSPWPNMHVSLFSC